MRISGVRVGRVKTKAANPETGLTDTEIEIDARYAPIPKDTRAILRQKTLLGETYVELSPGYGERAGSVGGRRQARRRAGGGDGAARRDPARVRPGDARRASAPGWTRQGVAAKGRRRRSTTRSRCSRRSPRTPTTSCRCCARRAARPSASCATPAYVFDALSERKGQLRDLISELEPHLGGDREPRRAARGHLPRASRRSCARGARRPSALTEFADDTDPLITQLRPAARELSPTLIDLDAPGAGPEGPVPRTSVRSCACRSAACRPPSRCSTTRGRSCAGSTRSCATSRRSSTTSASTSGRSRRSSRTTPRPRRAPSAAFNDRHFLHYLRTANPVNPEMMTGWPVPARHEPLEPVHRARRVRQAPDQGHLEVFGGQVCTSRPTPPPPAPERVAARSTWPRADRAVHLRRHRQPRQGAAVRPAGAARTRGRPVGAVPAPGTAAVSFS